MNAKGRVHKFGDNVDTDVIIPARYLNTASHKELAAHCMEDIDAEFVNKVNEGELNCSAANDSSMVSAVYVFPDNDEIDVFGRLLQVACWYDSKTPGYLLNFSHQQFFFELKDLRKQLQYRWIAERVNGKILLYGTHAPLGAKESSACYQEYRNELMYQNSINIKTKKI